MSLVEVTAWSTALALRIPRAGIMTLQTSTTVSLRRSTEASLADFAVEWQMLATVRRLTYFDQRFNEHLVLW